MKWYKNNYRRHLLDMHIDDWDDSFLAEFSPEKYFDNLKKAHISSPMIYLHSHCGHCYWPTKSGHTHKAMEKHPDAIRTLINMCREDGMAVVGYYSLIFNNYEHDRHPEWRLVGTNGKSLYESITGYRCGQVCPNNPGYREFLKLQISEILEYFTLDAIFYDQLFWPTVCHCEHCKKRYLSEMGKEIPERANTQEWQDFSRARERWLGEFAAFVADYTHSVNPDITVEQNFASACNPEDLLAETELVNDSCEFAGGDLYGGVLENSFTCKFYRNITKNLPFEYMTSRCNPNLFAHTITKPRDMLEQAVMLTCAYHGATLMIDAIDPVGTMDERVYSLIGEIFEKEEKYEKYLSSEDMVEEVALFYSMTSKRNMQGQTFNNHKCVLNAMKTLIGEHVPCGIITNKSLDSLHKYKALVLSNPNCLPEKTVDAVLNYVKEGGKLYLSGSDEDRLMTELFGCTGRSFTKHTKTYFAPTEQGSALLSPFNQKYPLPINFRVPTLTPTKHAAVLATLTLPYTDRADRQYSSIHSDPPGIPTDAPVLLHTKYGKGEVIWSASPIEYETVYDYKKIFVRIVNQLTGGNYLISTNAPANVELVVFKEDDGMQISAVNLAEQDEIFPVCSFEVSVKTAAPVKRFLSLPDESEIKFTKTQDGIRFTVDGLRIMNMYKLEY